MTWVRKRIDEYPWAEVKDWHEHQPWQADRGTFHRVYTQLVIHQKYMTLTPAERGLLHSLWILRTMSGHNVPRDPEVLRTILRLPGGRWLDKAMAALERRRWIIPRKGKLAGCRGEDGAIAPDEADEAPSDAMRPTTDQPRTNPGPTHENRGRVEVGQAKTPDQPRTNPDPTSKKSAAPQAVPVSEALQRREREERDQRPPPQKPKPTNGGRPAPDCACKQSGLIDGLPCDGCALGQSITHAAVETYRKRGVREGWDWKECVRRAHAYVCQPERQ